MLNTPIHPHFAADRHVLVFEHHEPTVTFIRNQIPERIGTDTVQVQQVTSLRDFKTKLPASDVVVTAGSVLNQDTFGQQVIDAAVKANKPVALISDKSHLFTGFKASFAINQLLELAEWIKQQLGL
jgi:fructose-1-phosphate kinase PfkB-like protein